MSSSREVTVRLGRAFPRVAAILVCLACVAGAQPALDNVTLPLAANSTRFAVLGDTGTGDTRQREVAARVEEFRQKTNFDFVILLGDNLYGSERPQDYRRKFEEPYRALLEAGVKFYAALGNHDDPNQRFYERFNMGGQRYYTHRHDGVEFFVLDSDYFDRRQLEWLRGALQRSTADWKIAYFHHPLYSSGGRHGAEEDLRELLEPLFVEHGVQVVFAGHEHFYERIKPQKGIYYFIVGASAKLARGDIQETDLTAAGFDTDRSFMVVEVAGDRLYFQTISRLGRTVDSGSIERPRR